MHRKNYISTSASTNYPLYSITCQPFQIKLFITSGNEILPCEKIRASDKFGKFENNKIIIDSDKISASCNKNIDELSIICKNCYNINCLKCHHAEIINKSCDSFISRKKFINQLTGIIEEIEESNNKYINFFNTN